MNWYTEELVVVVNNRAGKENNLGELEKLNYNEVLKGDESQEEIKSRTISLKLNGKQILSNQFFNLTLDEIEMKDVTHYAAEAQQIALKWKEKKKQSDS